MVIIQSNESHPVQRQIQQKVLSSLLIQLLSPLLQLFLTRRLAEILRHDRTWVRLVIVGCSEVLGLFARFFRFLHCLAEV